MGGTIDFFRPGATLQLRVILSILFTTLYCAIIRKRKIYRTNTFILKCLTFTENKTMFKESIKLKETVRHILLKNPT